MYLENTFFFYFFRKIIFYVTKVKTMLYKNNVSTLNISDINYFVLVYFLIYPQSFFVLQNTADKWKWKFTTNENFKNNFRSFFFLWTNLHTNNQQQRKYKMASTSVLPKKNNNSNQFKSESSSENTHILCFNDYDYTHANIVTAFKNSHLESVKILFWIIFKKFSHIKVKHDTLKVC